MLNAMRSGLRSETRRQSGEIVSLRRRTTVAAVRPISVVVGVVATTIVGWAVVASCEVHSLTIGAASILSESDTTVATARLIGLVASGLYVIVVESAGVEDDSREKHTLVYSTVFGHIIVHCDTLIVFEAGELLLCCGKRELKTAVRVV